jgi:general secretion pathway protein B
MSYILDALRRADAERERERGAVPGLHARTIPMGVPEPAAAPPQPTRRLLAVIVGALALLGLALWLWLRSSAPGSTPLAAAEQALAAPPAPAAASSAALVPKTAGASVPAAAPAAVAAASPPPPLVQIVPVPVPVPGSPSKRVPNPAVNPAANATPTAAQPAAGRSAASPAARAQPEDAPVAETPAPPERAVPLAQLPPELRRAWPPLVAGGSVYSESPGSRFVILNGQVVREGESPAPGITLERIGPKAAIFRWRDLRVELPL